MFKRKENVQLLHKWSSEDDDECADIESSGSNGQLQESLDLPLNNTNSKEPLAFEVSGLDLEIEGDRYTGTFANKNAATDKARNSSRAKRSRSPSVNHSPHNKPAHKTVIRANRANVRVSQKQSLRQKQRKEVIARNSNLQK